MVKALSPGTLYVVATPIGNLDDISARAISVLKSVDLIAAEDTRHTVKLCRQFGIATRLISMHSFNEAERSRELISRLIDGESLALVSDAGTPLISDPGYPLVKAAREQGIVVTPIPGACAFVAALSAAGLPSDRFVFEGFLPAKGSARRKSLTAMSEERGTIIFYESPHRITEFLKDVAGLYPERELVLARELTKTFETFLSGRPAQLLEMIAEDSNQQRGEFVVLMSGSTEEKQAGAGIDVSYLLRALIAEMPVKKAAAIVAEVTGLSKNELYKQALAIKGQ